MSSTDSRPISKNKNKSLLIKFLAILSIARWYNISLITISLYAIQIFIYENSFSFLIQEKGIHLHLYVLAIDLIIVGGYLINAFYDFEKDMINQPEKTYFNILVSKRSCLNIYILCNILGITLTFLINTKILIFSIFLILTLWIYSHKLRKKVLFEGRDIPCTINHLGRSLHEILRKAQISSSIEKIDSSMIVKLMSLCRK